MFLSWAFGSYFTVSAYLLNSLLPHIFLRAPSHPSKHSLMLSFSLISPFNLSCLFPFLFLILYLHGGTVLVSFLAIAIELLAKPLKEERVYAVHNVRLLSTFGNHTAGTVQAKCVPSQTRENADSVFFPFPYNLGFLNHWEVPSICSMVSVPPVAQFKCPILDLS